MINYFLDNIVSYKDNEIISIPWYTKKAWRKYAKGSCVSFNEYHNVSMLCQYILNACSHIAGCRIQRVRFVIFDGKAYERWARATQGKILSFSTQMTYVNSLQDITVNGLWRNSPQMHVYQLCGLLVKDVGAFPPCQTEYQLSDISDLLTAVLSDVIPSASLNVYPYIVPLASMPSLISIFHKDAMSFMDVNNRLFKPSFSNLAIQTVDFGEAWSDDGILYVIPIKLSPHQYNATVDLRIFSASDESSISFDAKIPHVTNLLRVLNSNFELVDSAIIPLSVLINEMMTETQTLSENA